MTKFSDWLKTYRKESGLSLMQLKAAIGDLCSDAYLSKLENDRYRGKKGKPALPDIEIVDALATALNRPVDEARLAAGYAARDNILPEQLRDIPFSRLDNSALAQVRQFVLFLLNQRSQADELRENDEIELIDIPQIGTLDDTGRAEKEKAA